MKLLVILILVLLLILFQGVFWNKFWARELTDSGVSRERIKEWLQAGLATVDGKPCKKPGQRLEGYERLTLHDFRVVPGSTHTNLVFDIVVPFEFSMTDEAVKKAVSERIHALEGNCFAVIDVDKSSLTAGE